MTRDFEAPSCSIHSPLPVNTRRTPLNNIPDQFNPQTEQPEQIVFPRVKVRNSRFKINEQIVRCTVQCLADYIVSPNDLTRIIVNTANIIFDLNWEKEDDVAAEEDEYDHIQSDTTEENISHSGKDGAAAYEFKLRCLAILANSPVDEIKNQVDFWMSDRAADCATLLDNLGISSNQIIKCCAHIILGVDHACDKVFRDIEQKIGIQKLLKVSVKKCSPLQVQVYILWYKQP